RVVAGSCGTRRPCRIELERERYREGRARNQDFESSLRSLPVILSRDSVFPAESRRPPAAACSSPTTRGPTVAAPSRPARTELSGTIIPKPVPDDAARERRRLSVPEGIPG